MVRGGSFEMPMETSALQKDCSVEIVTAGWETITLLSPAGLIIAIVVVRQLAQIGPIDAHDKDLTGVLVLAGYIGITGKCDPFTVGGEAGALGIEPDLGNPPQFASIGIHEIDIVCKGSTLIEGDQIVDRPVASPAGVDGVVNHFGVASVEVHDVKLILVVLPHGEQDLRSIRRPGAVVDILARFAEQLFLGGSIPAHDP